MADNTPTTSTSTGSSATDKRFDVVLGKATDKFELWQQIPAWVLGGAAILGGAVLIIFPHHLAATQSRDAWAAIIVALFLAVLLSYRSALTLNDDPPSAQAPNPSSPPAAQQQQGAGPRLAPVEPPTTPQQSPSGATTPPAPREQG